MGVSADSSGASADMTLAFEGGSKFIDRLNQLAEARERHEAALAALQEGQTIKQSLDEALERLARARADSERMRAEAKADADDILAGARAEADALQKQRAAERDALVKELAGIRSTHQVWIESSTAEANRLMAQASADAKAAMDARAEAEAARGELAAIADAANKAKDDADAARTRYEAAHARLATAINEASAIAESKT